MARVDVLSEIVIDQSVDVVAGLIELADRVRQAALYLQLPTVGDKAALPGCSTP